MTSVHAHLLRRPCGFWVLVAVGTMGSLGAVLTGSTIGSAPRPPRYLWWLHTPGGGYLLAHVLFYVSVAFLTLAWLGVGLYAFEKRLTVSRSWKVLALWATPLLVGSPLFGRDVYSYAAQGALARRGFNPYFVAPRSLGAGPLLSSVADVWHNTTSPYGPLFVALTHATATLAGGSLIAEVLAFRALALVGVVSLMVFIPVVARHYGANEGVAVWLAVLSPLALFSAVGSAHNDALMLGLVVTAIAVALRGRRRWAVALFALAATIKLPALAGVVFLYAGGWRDESARGRIRSVVEATVVVALVIIAVTETAGYGWAWVSARALSIPTRLRLLTSPTVSLGVLLATIAHAAGLHVGTRRVVTFVQHASEVFAVLAIAWITFKTRTGNVTRHFGVALLVVVVASPTVWPWYFLWGVTVLAPTSAQRSRLLICVAGGAMLLVGPGGTPMIGGNGFYVSGTLVAFGALWFFVSGAWRSVIRGVDRAA